MLQDVQKSHDRNFYLKAILKWLVGHKLNSTKNRKNVTIDCQDNERYG
jgi:hypothetical protein